LYNQNRAGLKPGNNPDVAPQPSKTVLLLREDKKRPADEGRTPEKKTAEVSGEAKGVTTLKEGKNVQ